MGILYGDTIIRFDPTISWGTVLSVLTFIFAVWALYQKLMAHSRQESNRLALRMERMETKLNVLWSAWRRHNGARTDEDEQFFNGPH